MYIEPLIGPLSNARPKAQKQKGLTRPHPKQWGQSQNGLNYLTLRKVRSCGNRSPGGASGTGRPRPTGAFTGAAVGRSFSGRIGQAGASINRPAARHCL